MEICGSSLFQIAIVVCTVFLVLKWYMSEELVGPVRSRWSCCEELPRVAPSVVSTWLCVCKSVLLSHCPPLCWQKLPACLLWTWTVTLVPSPVRSSRLPRSTGGSFVSSCRPCLGIELGTVFVGTFNLTTVARSV